jgi:hypothetical protein
MIELRSLWVFIEALLKVIGKDKVTSFGTRLYEIEILMSGHEE